MTVLQIVRALLTLCVLLGVAPANAQSYPDRPIRLVVAFVPDQYRVGAEGAGFAYFLRTLAAGRIGRVLCVADCVQRRPRNFLSKATATIAPDRRCAAPRAPSA